MAKGGGGAGRSPREGTGTMPSGQGRELSRSEMVAKLVDLAKARGLRSGDATVIIRQHITRPITPDFAAARQAIMGMGRNG